MSLWNLLISRMILSDNIYCNKVVIILNFQSKNYNIHHCVILLFMKLCLAILHNLLLLDNIIQFI